jgi:hypothetical protein
MQDQKKQTNATNKCYLLQHQNKAIATKTEQSAMRESSIRKKKTNITNKYYLLQH